MKTTITLRRGESFRYVDFSDELYTYIRVCLYKDGLEYDNIVASLTASLSVP